MVHVQRYFPEMGCAGSHGNCRILVHLTATTWSRAVSAAELAARELHLPPP